MRIPPLVRRLPTLILLLPLLLPAGALSAPPTVNLDPENAGGVSPNISAGFLEGGGPVRIAPAATISDPDGGAIDEIVLELDPAGATDRLDAKAGDSGVGVTWDGTTLRLAGPAPPADF